MGVSIMAHGSEKTIMRIPTGRDGESPARRGREHFISRAILALVVWLLFFATTAQAQTPTETLALQQEALNSILDATERICQTPPLEEIKTRVQLSGAAKAEISGVLKRLTDLGISGAASVQRESDRGVVHEQLAEAIAKGDDCRREVLNILRAVIPGLAVQSKIGQSSLTAGNLLLVSANAKPLQSFIAASSASPPNHVPVRGYQLDELRLAQLDKHIENPHRGPSQAAYIGKTSDTCGNHPAAAVQRQRKDINQSECRLICEAECCQLRWRREVAGPDPYAFRDVFIGDNRPNTSARRIKKLLVPNNLGIALYEIDQVYQAEPPSWYRSDVECAGFWFDGPPGDSTPFVLDLLVRNAGETETDITGFVAIPLYLGHGECGGGGFEFGPVNEQALMINVDADNITTGRFDTKIGIEAGKTSLLRTAVAKDPTECGAALISRLSLLYFDGHRERQLLVGNFVFF